MGKFLFKVSLILTFSEKKKGLLIWGIEFLILKIQLLNVLAQNRHIDLMQLNQNKKGYKYYRAENELCIKNPDPSPNEDEGIRYKSCLKI